MVANGLVYFQRPSTIYDVLMVIGSTADLVVIIAMDVHEDNERVKHIMRAIHALRIIRFLKALQWFSSIHLLLRACQPWPRCHTDSESL